MYLHQCCRMAGSFTVSRRRLLLHLRGGCLGSVCSQAAREATSGGVDLAMLTRAVLMLVPMKTRGGVLRETVMMVIVTADVMVVLVLKFVSAVHWMKLPSLLCKSPR